MSQIPYAELEARLLEVVKAGPIAVPPKLFSLIALLAVSNTALINMIMGSRLLYGMAEEGIVPRVLGWTHSTRRTPWVAIVFTALLGLARAWVPEQEHGVLDGLVLAPCDRSAIWLGKTVATLAFLLAAQAVALPAFVLFFEPLDAQALVGVLLADVGICAVGSLVSAMAAASRGREVLLPLIFLPLAIPIVVGGVGASISEEPGKFLAFLGLYDAVFAILSWAAFEYVVTE